jgi:hypothetical protein
MGTSLGILANLASRNLHSSALENVFYSPKSMFDTQPLGRILGVFGKDIDTIDNQLPDSLRMMALTLITVSDRQDQADCSFSVRSSSSRSIYTTSSQCELVPDFRADDKYCRAFDRLLVSHSPDNSADGRYFALFYRTSSREVKRLDSMLRSLLYSHFSES